ncbi:MAG: carboxylate--amine ligase, partial [Peptoniphilus harei]|nr:carboxylate--amine ligase [Peptoniphilus harei]
MKNISKDILKNLNVKFVILGSDENAYGIARLLNDNYDLISNVFCQKALAATDNSKILKRKIIENFSDDEIFVKEMINFAKENEDATLITIPCGDEYSKLLSNNKEKIKEYYRFNTPSTELNEKLE